MTFVSPQALWSSMLVSVLKVLVDFAHDSDLVSHRLGEQRDFMTSVFAVILKVRGCGLTWAGASKASYIDLCFYLCQMVCTYVVCVTDFLLYYYTPHCDTLHRGAIQIVFNNASYNFQLEVVYYHMVSLICCQGMQQEKVWHGRETNAKRLLQPINQYYSFPISMSVCITSTPGSPAKQIIHVHTRKTGQY